MKKTKYRQKYPNALKRKVAQEYLSGKFSYAVGAEEYGLKGKSVVREFVKWYEKNHDIEQMTKKDSDEEKRREELTKDEEVARLQRELEAAKLKIAGLETMIEVAEQELQIEIRKKSGTKQSK